jgi:hypothetical protein
MPLLVELLWMSDQSVADIPQAFRNNSGASNFAKHLNEHAHSFGNIDSTMQRKSPHLNTLEKYRIHEEASRKKQPK